VRPDERSDRLPLQRLVPAAGAAYRGIRTNGVDALNRSPVTCTTYIPAGSTVASTASSRLSFASSGPSYSTWTRRPVTSNTATVMSCDCCTATLSDADVLAGFG